MNRFRLSVLAGLFFSLGSCAFGQTKIDLGSRVMPAAHGEVTGLTVNGKLLSGSPTLGQFDVGAMPGPGTGTSAYYTQAESGGSAIDTVQGYITYMTPTASSGFQVVWGNSSGLNEACGPQMSIRAAIEYPVDSGLYYPLFFNGVRDANLDPCGILTSDALSLDTTLTAQVLQVRYRAARAPTSSVVFPSGWNFHQVYGTSMAPYTTTKTGGYWDGVEELKTRTVTDGVTNGTTSFTSATAAFQAQDAGQSIAITGAGAAGALYTGTILTYINAMTVLLSSIPATTVSAASTTITPADKTTSGTIYNAAIVNAYTPHMLLARPTGMARSVGLVGDSIEAGQGGLGNIGSFAIQALNPTGATAGLSTAVNVAIPYHNESMPSETISNLSRVHAFRFAALNRDKYILGMLGGNDLATGTVATMAPNFLILVTKERQLGASPFYGTVVPRSTSTDGWLTLAGQTTLYNNQARLDWNAWLRDGAPMDCTTLAYAPTGTSSTTAARAAYYSVTGTVVNPASGPCVHPAGGLFELADAVETSRDSGIWQVDPNVRTMICSAPVGVNPVLTCPAGTFTTTDSGRQISIPGAGVSGANLVAALATFTGSTTTIPIGGRISTAVTSVPVLVDGALMSNTGGKVTVDGTHPAIRGHYLMGQVAGKTAATFTW
jgi:hypothetical protein